MALQLIKAFRLFVSSTFADFAAERDILHRDVFPTLEIYCAAKGYQFHPLDLRWGVNEEAQLDQRTAEICLSEVRSAKVDYPPPNFLIMVGNRYGFVPLPYAIAQDEFESIITWLGSRGKQGAAHSLQSVYQLDSNYLIPQSSFEAAVDGDDLTGAFTLRSRVDELPELRSAEAWAKREAELRSALQDAAEGLMAIGKINIAAYEKYFLSLTHQEIIEGLPDDRPIVDRAYQPSSDVAGPVAIAFIREIVTEFSIVPEAVRSWIEYEPRLDRLKDAIKRTLPAANIFSARTAVGEDGTFPETYLADFAVQI